MRNIPNAGFDNLDAVKSDGTALKANREGAKGVTIPGAGTWYFPVGSSESSFVADLALLAISLQWDNAAAGVFSLEVSNFPLFERGGDKGLNDTLDYDQTAGLWIPVNPSNSYGAASAGNNYANGTLTAVVANAGGGALVFPWLGHRRARIKAAMTAGGLVRCGAWGKLLVP